MSLKPQFIRARRSSATRRTIRIGSGLGGVVAILAITPKIGIAQAMTPDEMEAALVAQQAILDNIWVFLAGCLVFFMQAGFALVEAGLTRAKNVVNIFAKNLADAFVGITMFWLVGFGFAFGGSGEFIGTNNFLLHGVDLAIPAEGGLSGATTFFFQAVFAATAVTIVSGAMAERMKFPAYLLFGTVMCAFIYPVVVHWTWGGGLISQINIGDAAYSDFAGSGIVHMTGGVAALVGATIIGPRIGKYDSSGRPRAIPGHNIPLAILGVFILWLGWFGFNPGSELAADGNVMIVAVNTLLAAIGGGLACTITIWFKSGKPDLAMIGNGVLAGLVSITAGCGTVNQIPAFIIGALGGVIVVFAVYFFDNRKIDDPVGAISVHGICGIWGVLAVGLWAHNPDLFVDAVVGADAYEPSGLLYGGGVNQILVQATMVLIVAAWVAITTAVTFLILKSTVGLRVSAEEEIEGLDVLEHGLAGYSGDLLQA